jgi:hypothetical protein
VIGGDEGAADEQGEGHWGESLPATQLALDLIIAFVAIALWAAWEGRALRMLYPALGQARTVGPKLARTGTRTAVTLEA